MWGCVRDRAQGRAQPPEWFPGHLGRQDPGTGTQPCQRSPDPHSGLEASDLQGTEGIPEATELAAQQGPEGPGVRVK